MSTGEEVPDWSVQRVGHALAWATELHAGQTRKGKPEPYLTHLLRVCGLVLTYGGTDVQATAAALHDAAEDQGGEALLSEIENRFGADVAAIVRDCSDSLTVDPGAKAPWRVRKMRHLEHLAHPLREESILVTACDKLANLEDLVDDLRLEGEVVFERFNGGAAGTRAYYAAMYSLLADRLPEKVRERFASLLAELHESVPAPADVTSVVNRFAAATEHLTH
jgi:(p)ppGpp synthase/HD superfamily hydrolase